MFSKYLTQALLAVSCAVSVANIHAGVSNDTIVQTNNGPQHIKVLKIGDKVLCSNMQNLAVEERAIQTIEDVVVDNVIEITTSDNVSFYVAGNQKLFVTHKWVDAQQLTLEDVLMKQDRTCVKVVGIRHLNKPMTVRFITVDEHHNFFAAENGVLIHNGYWGATIGCTVSMSLTQFVYHGTVCGISSLAGPAAPGVAAVIYFWTMPAATAVTYANGVAGGIALGVATGPI